MMVSLAQPNFRNEKPKQGVLMTAADPTTHFTTTTNDIITIISTGTLTVTKGSFTQGLIYSGFDGR